MAICYTATENQHNQLVCFCSSQVRIDGDLNQASSHESREKWLDLGCFEHRVDSLLRAFAKNLGMLYV